MLTINTQEVLNNLLLDLWSQDEDKIVEDWTPLIY